METNELHEVLDEIVAEINFQRHQRHRDGYSGGRG